MACVVPLGSQVNSYIHGCSASQVSGATPPVPGLLPQTLQFPPATDSAAPCKGADTLTVADPASESDSGGQSSQTAQEGVGPLSNREDNAPNAGANTSGTMSERLRTRSLRCCRSRELSSLERAQISAGEIDTASTPLKRRSSSRAVGSSHQAEDSKSPRCPLSPQANDSPTSRKRALTSAAAKTPSVEGGRVTGKSMAEKLTAARALAQNLTAEAKAAEERAHLLIQIAQYKARQEAESKASKRQKVVRADATSGALPHPARPSIRITVLWDDNTYHKAKITTYKPQTQQHLLTYDDGATDWIDLRRQRFRWLIPRAATAGCSPNLREEMLELGAEGLPKAPLAAVAPQEVGLGPRGEAAVGWRLELYTAPQCRWYRAEVLAFNENGFHHLLYQDGEDEWVDLSREAVQWLTSAPLEPLGAGLPPGQLVPVGQQAVGWRVSVYWLRDSQFHSAVIKHYNLATGRHELEYDERGTMECLMLMAEKIKWVHPPKAAHACAAKTGLLLTTPEAERESSGAWRAPTCIIPSSPLHEAWGTNLRMGLRTVRLPGWQQKPAGPLLGTHSWSSTPAAVSPLLPSCHSAPLSTPPAPRNIALHSFCSLNSAAAKTAVLHDDEEGCISFTSGPFALQQELEPLTADLPIFSEPLIFAPKVAQPIDAAGDLIKQDLLPEDAILDPSDVLALDNLTAEDTADGSETFIKNEPDTPPDRSESLTLYGSGSNLENTLTPAWAATSDSADRIPMSYCFEPSFESAIETLLDPPSDYHDALFADFHIAADAHESLWVLA
eukprot:jgi/Botrbrau1/591/Bobra.0010s0056.1